MKKVDVLIIGQGLAGTILHDLFVEKGVSCLVVDKYREITSSKVAAGIMNPITGRRFAKTWLAEELFSYSNEYYKRKENELSTSFYHSLPVHRYLGSVEDQNTWMGRSADEDIQKFVGEKDLPPIPFVNSEFGGAEILGGGYVDTTTFLAAARERMIVDKVVIDDQVNLEDINIQKSGITWKNIEAKHIIFCEGFRSTDNPLFSWLPFTFAKGEIFDLQIDDLPKDRIYNRNGFIMPRENGTFKMGATYRWNEMNEEATERSKIELIEKLEKITSAKYTILDQKASIRPTVKDRRPFIGHHPLHTNVHIFNGFGSKGVTLIPYFAKHFSDVIAGKESLMEEVNIERYYKEYRI